MEERFEKVDCLHLVTGGPQRGRERDLGALAAW
jgi:hypothetical protein